MGNVQISQEFYGALTLCGPVFNPVPLTHGFLQLGLTYPKEFIEVKKFMPKAFFLIPGYGAQGGTGKDIAEIFKDDICGVVNSSRGIISAHKGKIEDENFTELTVKAVKDMQEDIGQWL